MKWLKRLLVALVVLLGLAAAFLGPTIWGKPWSVNHFYMRYLLRSLLPHPMLLSTTGVLRPTGLTFYEHELGDFSLEALEQQSEYQESELKVLHRYDRAAMSKAEQLSYDVMEFWLEAGLLRVPERFLLHDYAIQQMSGLHVQLPDFMISTHRFDSPEYADWYIDRVSKFEVAIDQEIDLAQRQAKAGIIPPRFILERVRKDLVSFTSSAAQAHPLYTHYRDETERLAGLSPEHREASSRRLAQIIDESVLPAWHRLIRRVDELMVQATDDAGAWKLPSGDDYYAYRLYQSTTTKLSAEEIHAMGLAQLEALQAEAREILTKEGYPSDRPIGELIRGLSKEARFGIEDTEEGRTWVIEEYRRIIAEAEQGMGDLFGLKPPVGVEVKPVPGFREKSAPAGYYKMPPMDFSRPGEFYANLGSLGEQSKIMMRTLAFHEAIPGHHFQIAVALGLQGLPAARRILPFMAYGEGWALYAERLAAEQGYQKNAFDRLGYLDSQLFRAVRLVVDTGLHHKRWTRQQAVDFMRDNCGTSEKDIQIEIDRYVVWPGQASSYMTGQLKILELREKLKAKLGDQFSLSDFHDRVLGSGGLPLFLLERVVLDN